jgi:hypothetical protein
MKTNANVKQALNQVPTRQISPVIDSKAQNNKAIVLEAFESPV